MKNVTNINIDKQHRLDPDWQYVYKIEDKINQVINEVYHGKIIVRCEFDELYTIKILFLINKKKYEYIISKRNNDYGFSIYNIDTIDNMYEYQKLAHNITIKNDKFYLYNIYKIIFRVIR